MYKGGQDHTDTHTHAHKFTHTHTHTNIHTDVCTYTNQYHSGYHGDDGNAFQGSGAGRPFGPTYGTGDVMGVLLNRSNRTIR